MSIAPNNIILFRTVSIEVEEASFIRFQTALLSKISTAYAASANVTVTLNVELPLYRLLQNQCAQPILTRTTETMNTHANM